MNMTNLNAKKRFLKLLSSAMIVLLFSSQQSYAQISSFPYFYDFENENTGSTGCNPTYPMVQAGWLNAAGDDMDWTNDINTTGSSSTGPNLDHTPSGTFYMYLETSCGTSSARTANLETPVFNFASAPAPQVSFWYHMYGATMNTLFFEVTTNGGGTWTTLWSRAGQQHTSSAAAWSQAVVNTAPYGGQASVQFRFRGTSPVSSFTGDMAIDDFLVENILPNNAGISALVNPLPGGTAGLQAVDVTLTNFGSNTLNNVNIEWEVNGVPQTSVNYTTPSIVAFGSNTVNLGTYTFTTGVTNVKAWTSMPNSLADSDNGNDTLNAVFCTGYSGVYTAGTVTSDFLTIQDAIDALESCGVNGPVTVNVQPGTYNGQISFSSIIPGSSLTNTVTFDGQGTAFLTSGSSGVPTVAFNGGRFVTIQNFDITCTATTDSWGVHFTNGSDWNQVLNNNIDMPYSPNIFDVGGIVFSGSYTSYFTLGDNGDRNLIQGNRITGGDRGISMMGPTGTTLYNKGNRIVDNIIVGVDDYGMYIDEQDSIIVMGNRVDSVMSTFGDGVYMYDFMNFEIIGNTVTAPDWAFYINDGNSNTTPIGRSKFINNMILSETDYGFYAFDFESVDFWHNTIKGEPAVYANDWDNQVSIKNNIFASDNDYAFENVDVFAVSNMDYNIFYTAPGNNLFVKWGTPTYTNLAAWQAGPLSYDANSKEQDPGFVGPRDLHVTNPFAYDAGDATLGITSDIDGDARPGFGSVGYDIGADEFALPSDDAGVLALVNPTAPTTIGIKNIEFTIQNFGGNVINPVTVDYEIDGVPQPTYLHTTNIPGAGNVDQVVGTYNFTGGLATVKAWTSQPNNVADVTNNNDTLYAFFCAGLSGTYTVGTVTSDFATLQMAVDALLGCGVAGPVTMQVQPGTHTALTLNQPIPGISSTNTVTFDGSALAASISVSTGAAVVLDGVDYITIQNFTLSNSTTTQGWGIRLSNQADHNSILNNRIQMATTNAFNTAAIVATNSPTSVSSNGNNANYTLIEGNVISGADRGISLFGSSTIALYNSGNVIRNNVITDVDNYGIYTYYQDSLVISGNLIHEFPSTFHYGIYAFYSMNFDVIGNDVRSEDYGIYMNRSNSQTTPTRRGLVANNMVQSTGDRATYMVFTRNTDYYHNTVVSALSASTWSNFDNTVDVKNNIFITTSASSNNYAFETFSTTTFMGMDYNVFYATNPSNSSLIDYGGLFGTLANWQANGPYGYDQNSLEGLPDFASPTDLHVDGAFLNDKGINTTAVLVDIDGEVRPALGAAAVDIGADEFTPPGDDAGVTTLASPTLPITGGFFPVEIVVENFGINDLASFSVEWEINGLAQVAVPYIGSAIPVGGTTVMTLANINFPANTTSLKFWTTMPNGMPDERTSNDTLDIAICPGLSGIYTVGTPSSDYPTVQEAIDVLLTCGVSGPVVMEFAPGLYTGPWSLYQIPGANAVNTVTFDGIDALTTTISHTGFGVDQAATVILDGVDYFTLKNFTVHNTGINTAYGVLFINGANHNTVEDNIISMPISSGLNNVIGVLTSDSYSSSTGGSAEGNNANWNLLKGNEIIGGVSGVIFEGGVADNENIGNQIIGNDIHDAQDYGIYADEQDSFSIIANHVHNINGTTSDAIMLYDVHHFNVSKNEVNSRDYGIAIFGGFAAGDEVTDGLITNNMVACQSGGEALYIREAATIYIYHNTLSGMPACWLDNHGNIDLRNNILTTANSYCFYTLDPVSMIDMDHNLYNITSPAGMAVRFGSTNYATLASWQGFGLYDLTSVTGNPIYVNGLHVSGPLPVDAGDTTLVYPVMDDFDNEARPMGVLPDIGADEHIVATNDAMVLELISPVNCGDTAQAIIVKVANIGTAMLFGVPVTVNVSGAGSGSFNGTQGLITSGGTATMNLGTINTSAGGVFNFEVIVNVGTDSNPLNDTLYTSLNIAPSNQVAITMTGDNFICQGSVTTLSATASYSPATINWYDAPVGGNLVSVGTSYITPPLSAVTTYYAEVQGCNSPRAMYTVDLDMVGINVDLGLDATVCGGASVDVIPTITLSQEVSLVWSDGSQSAFIEVYNAGVYYATVTNINGCEHTDSITISLSPAPTILDVVSDVTCGGFADGAIDLSLSGTPGPFSYQWSNGETTEDLAGLSGGFYQITITDNGTASDCAFDFGYTIAEPNAYTANIDDIQPACSGAEGSISISVLGGTPGYSYLWSNATTEQNATGLSAGNYTVTITDANGCVLTENTTIAAVTPITVTVDTIFDEIMAVQGGVNITATGSGPFGYNWNTGATTADVTGLVAGTYSVTVTDLGTGCQTVVGGIVVVYKIPDFVNNIIALNAFKLYPNPTEGRVWVDLTLAEMTSVQLDVLSVTGQVVHSYAPRETLEQRYELDMSEFPSGVYLARFVIGSEVMTTKIIVE